MALVGDVAAHGKLVVVFYKARHLKKIGALYSKFSWSTHGCCLTARHA